jgi:hypothetical protein
MESGSEARKFELTPDGARYLAAAEKRVARPFHYRWLLPRLLGTDDRKWKWTNHAALWACLPLAYLFAGSGWRGVAAAGLVMGLNGVWHFNRRFVVLVDATGMMLALASAVAFQHGLWPVCVALALLGGCVRETAPVFAALYAWNPLPLIGLLAPAVRHLQRQGDDVLDGENAWVLAHPVLASRKYHAGIPRAHYVLPWGASLVALANVSPQLAAVVAVAYAQCLVATDTVRLYMWSWPVVVAAAVHAVPLSWLPVVVALTLANPFASEGG